MPTFIKSLQRIWRRLLAKETTDNQDNVVIATSPAPLSAAAVKMQDLRAQINILLQDLNLCGIVDFPTNPYYDYTRSIIGYYQLHGSSRQSLTTIWLGARGVHPADEHDLYDKFVLCVSKLDTILKAHFEEHPEKMYASPRLPYPTNIHFCSDYPNVWRHYRPLYDRVIAIGPQAYINHSVLLLLGSLTSDSSEHLDFYNNGDMYDPVNIELLSDWVINSQTIVPRVVKVALWLSLDYQYYFCLGDLFSAKLDHYLMTDFTDELRKYAFDEQYSLFLRHYILKFSCYTFGSIDRFHSYQPPIKEIQRCFYIKHPVFYPWYIFSGLFDEKSSETKDLDISNNDMQPNHDQDASSELFTLDSNLDSSLNPRFNFDQGFFDRLKAETQLLLPNMTRLEYLLWINRSNSNDNYPFYNELIVWLRSKGFEFEGDDPLGLRYLVDQWKDVKHMPDWWNKAPKS